MNITTSFLIAAGLACALACGDAPTDVGDPLDPLGSVHQDPGVDRVTVMTQNLYVGTDVDAVLAALISPDETDDFPALITAIQTFQATDFPARAAAFADAIARERPHVVGLQEISDVLIDLTELGIPVSIHQRFLPILEAALAARGLPYVTAATILDFTASPLPGVELKDYEAVLVDTSRATVTHTHARLFSHNLGMVAPGVALERGLVEVTATIGGRPYVFVSTHLEPDLAGHDLSGLRAAQAYELAVAVVGSSTPAFVMGDPNDRPGSPMYQVLQQAGFTDVWAELRPGVQGYTSPRDPDLANPADQLTKRIDYIWVRGLGHAGAGLRGQVERLGVRPWERIQGPLYAMWPSDHAGLVANLIAARPVGP
ncbi:MAG TPA: endonuclease/exonuclease/phosphatase family protein [Gemmatimonadales bacterium]|nr:endonuclease/exonuclease/phosphatase family protein [Gemmatimonadales bacterium]